MLTISKLALELVSRWIYDEFYTKISPARTLSIKPQWQMKAMLLKSAPSDDFLLMGLYDIMLL